MFRRKLVIPRKKKLGVAHWAPNALRPLPFYTWESLYYYQLYDFYIYVQHYSKYSFLTNCPFNKFITFIYNHSSPL